MKQTRHKPPFPSRKAALQAVNDITALADFGAIALADEKRIDAPHVRKRIAEIREALVGMVKGAEWRKR